MRLFPNFLATLNIAAAAVMAAPLAAPAAQLDCLTFTHSEAAIVTGVQTTSSRDPVNLPGAAIDVIFPDNTCVMVEFSAQVKARMPNAVRIRAVSVGQQNKTAFPTSVDFTTASNGYDGRSVTFVFNRLQGENTVRIRFESLDGSPVAITKGVMRVIYHDTIS